ncbi:MAG TPA: DUF2007 domain-containing protein [Gemmataceae bacterium]|nr:DUF2007 domain-containing protein [Gemmataceae bacterium]
MSGKIVTVMTFNQHFEARLAKNLLENEGIDSMVAGELSADMLPFGHAGGRDPIVLQVHEDDAQRATGILAVVAAAKLDKDWEEQTEAGVWICSLCGEPISNHLSMCYSCETPRESIRTSAPRDRTAIQPDPSTLPTGEEVQIRDEIACAPSEAPRGNNSNRDEELSEPRASASEAATPPRSLTLAALFKALFELFSR